MSSLLLSRLSGKKRKHSKQVGIGNFLSRPRNIPVVNRIGGGHIKCPWCPAGNTKLYNEQGFATHKRKHQANNDPLLRQHNDGKVKVRLDLMSPEQIAQYNESKLRDEVVDDDDDDVEVVENGDVDGSSEDDVNNDDLLAYFESGGGGTVPAVPELNRDTGEDVEDDDMEVDDDGGNVNDDEGNCVVRQRNWKPKEIMEVLNDYDNMNGKANKKAFVRYVRKEYKRPKFQPKRLREWLKNRDEIEASAQLDNADRRRISVPKQTTGQYPEMEHRLAVSIRFMRQMGIVVEAWMVDWEAKTILHDLYPNKFAMPGVVDGDMSGVDSEFKCSNTWRRNFYKRHGFTQRKIGKKMNKKGTEAERMKKVYEFHLMLRALQLSEKNDPVYGLTSPYYV